MPVRRSLLFAVVAWPNGIRRAKLGEGARHDVLHRDSIVRDVVISRPASLRAGVTIGSHPSRDAPEAVVPAHCAVFGTRTSWVGAQLK
jgi:hypothetical protein